jgi:uncharacterized protein YqkB
VLPHHRRLIAEVTERFDADPSVDDPTVVNAETLTAAVSGVVGIELTVGESSSRFTEQTEWSWRYERPPLGDS